METTWYVLLGLAASSFVLGTILWITNKRASDRMHYQASSMAGGSIGSRLSNPFDNGGCCCLMFSFHVGTVALLCYLFLWLESPLGFYISLAAGYCVGMILLWIAAGADSIGATICGICNAVVLIVALPMLVFGGFTLRVIGAIILTAGVVFIAVIMFMCASNTQYRT
ncbi:MAG: hypothetical protein K2R98_05335 [Gemmataceae bacterium]|nr:hypothetical protein [Gemmataceae bacterium]